MCRWLTGTDPRGGHLETTGIEAETRARWRETSVHELSGRDGGPIETVEYSDLDIAKSILFMLNRPGAQIDAIADSTHDPGSRGRR